MRYMVWPRQYGKTYQIEQWWLENPQNRAIVTNNEQNAREIRGHLVRELASHYPGLFDPEIDRLVKQRVMSWRSWGSTRGEAWRTKAEIAVDEVGALLQSMLNANVTVIAGSGKNDEPDPAAAARIYDGFGRAGMDPDE